MSEHRKYQTVASRKGECNGPVSDSTPVDTVKDAEGDGSLPQSETGPSV